MRGNGWPKSVSRNPLEWMEKKLKRKLPGGKFAGVPVVRSRIMRSIRGKQTKTTEVALRMALIRAGIRGWKLNPTGIAGSPDVVFPGQRVVVFADGCFWHGCFRCGHVPKTRGAFWRAKLLGNRQRDRRNSAALRRSGFTVIRVWEHELATDLGRVVDRILRAFSRA